MPSQTRRNHLRRRRRVQDDAEDEIPAANHLDDSQSENSLPSDDEGDADDSDLSDTDRLDSLGPEEHDAKSKGAVTQPADQAEAAAVEPSGVHPGKENAFTISKDTETMMNGLSISESAPQEEGLDFEGVQGPAVVSSDSMAAPSNGPKGQESFAERKRREHEEYKKKRDENPAFIPTRGAFFMHDQRSSQGTNGARGLGRGRGRGREVVGGPFSPANLRPQPPDATKSAWAHDLHDTLHEQEAQSGASQLAPKSIPAPSVVAPQALGGAGKLGKPPVRNYSTTRDMGHTQIRVRMEGMKEPVIYSNKLIKQYTKLPDHRPPLRRDKPVRISIPDKTPRYIFPAVDRSFIFIPRAMRPNQQGFGRGRAKLGSMGGFSSRRTSVFGGSVYSPSVAMSRRSSFAREFNREGMPSPAGSVRPVVRLPPGSHHGTAVGTPIMMSGHGTPVMNAPPMYPMYPPQKPAYRETWPANMPMHQPRPQKAVSVAGIESPAYGFQPPQAHEMQPFSHQLPVHVNGSNGQPDNAAFQQRAPSYQGQTTGTPLSNIPERAIHAPAFQPYQQPTYQPGAAYYYPQMPPQYQQGAVIAPMVVPNGQQGSYLVPAVAPAPPGAAPQPMQTTGVPPAQGQPQIQQFEQNGMVFYYDPAQMYMQPEGQTYPNYAMPGVGGMMTPAPEGYWTGPVYYQ